MEREPGPEFKGKLEWQAVQSGSVPPPSAGAPVNASKGPPDAAIPSFVSINNPKKTSHVPTVDLGQVISALLGVRSTLHVNIHDALNVVGESPKLQRASVRIIT
jgi:hypothetical protein